MEIGKRKRRAFFREWVRFADPDFPGYSEEYYRAVAKDAGDRLKVAF